MNHDEVIKFKNELAQDVYFCMEWSKQSYNDVMDMPVKRFRDYLKWKRDYEQEKQNLIDSKFKEG